MVTFYGHDNVPGASVHVLQDHLECFVCISNIVFVKVCIYIYNNIYVVDVDCRHFSRRSFVKDSGFQATCLTVATADAMPW